MLNSPAGLEYDPDKKFLGDLENESTIFYKSDLGNCPDVFHSAIKQRVCGEQRGGFYVIIEQSYVKRALRKKSVARIWKKVWYRGLSESEFRRKYAQVLLNSLVRKSKIPPIQMSER